MSPRLPSDSERFHRLIPAAALVAAFIGGLPASAAAIDFPTRITVSPANAAPGEPVTITAIPKNPIGTPTFSWDLDFDASTGGPVGPCETTPSTHPSITVTRPAGAYRIRSCVSDARLPAPGMICEHSFLVGPKPVVDARWQDVDLDTFHRQGTTVSVGWTPAMSTTYWARYTSAATPPLFGEAVNLSVSSARGPDGRDILRIGPPPPDAVRPYVPGINHSPSVSFGPALVSEPYSGFMFLDDGFELPTYGWWPTPNAEAQTNGRSGTGPTSTRSTVPAIRDPRIRVLSARRAGSVLRVALASGAAAGQKAQVTLTYRVAGATETARRTVRLRSTVTRIEWRLSSRVWRAGGARIHVGARFKRDGVVFRTPPGARSRVRWSATRSR